MDLFSYDAAQQHDERKAARTASVLFNLRASERYEDFLRQAANKDEFEQRVALIQNDLGRLASAVRLEHEAGALLLENAFIERIAGGAFCDDCRCWKVGPKKMCECGDEGNGEGALSDDVSAVGKGASVHTAEDNLGGKGKPSPEIDKKTWKPNALNDEGNLKPIDTDGGRYKSETQDLKDTPDWSNEDRAQGAVLDTNTDITKVDDQPAIHTDTWSGTEGQANPVTSSARFLSREEIFDAIVLYGD